MATGAEIIRKYAVSNDVQKVGIICQYYPTFTKMLDGRIQLMLNYIWSEMEYEKSKNKGELGVRVQTSSFDDITSKEAISRESIRDSIVSCIFDNEIYELIDGHDEIIAEAHIIRSMRQDFDIFNLCLYELGMDESGLFWDYINRKKSLTDIADEFGILYASASRKIIRIKKDLIKAFSEDRNKVVNCYETI